MSKTEKYAYLQPDFDRNDKMFVWKHRLGNEIEDMGILSTTETSPI